MNHRLRPALKSQVVTQAPPPTFPATDASYRFGAIFASFSTEERKLQAFTYDGDVSQLEAARRGWFCLKKQTKKKCQPDCRLLTTSCTCASISCSVVRVQIGQRFCFFSLTISQDKHGKKKKRNCRIYHQWVSRNNN